LPLLLTVMELDRVATLELFKRMPVTQLLEVARVSKRWRDLARSNQVWEPRYNALVREEDFLLLRLVARSPRGMMERDTWDKWYEVRMYPMRDVLKQPYFFYGCFLRIWTVLPHVWLGDGTVRVGWWTVPPGGAFTNGFEQENHAWIVMTPFGPSFRRTTTAKHFVLRFGPLRLFSGTGRPVTAADDVSVAATVTFEDPEYSKLDSILAAALFLGGHVPFSGWIVQHFDAIQAFVRHYTRGALADTLYRIGVPETLSVKSMLVALAEYNAVFAPVLAGPVAIGALAFALQRYLQFLRSRELRADDNNLAGIVLSVMGDPMPRFYEEGTQVFPSCWVHKSGDDLLGAELCHACAEPLVGDAAVMECGHGCGAGVYCGQECADAHWTEHAEECDFLISGAPRPWPRAS
jgi:hypothetical protein